MPAKRKNIALDTKVTIIEAVQRGAKKGDVAKQYEIKPSTLSTILGQSEKIMEEWSRSGSLSQRKKIRSAKYDDIDKALLQWFTEQRAHGAPISGPLMLEKAKKFAEALGQPDFKASTGFLDSFKDRHGITFRAICGESAAANVDGATDWKTHVLPQLLQCYSDDDIYNADESALFYECLPNHTMTFKSDDCSGGKRSKVRITLLFCCNMSGSDKRRLLVIGKYSQPRCFKNVEIRHLPVEYVANKKAWMTAEIWNRWLVSFDRSIVAAGRRVLLIVDNASCHHMPAPTLQGIKLVFLPPNTTSLIQPLDQGIIQCFKVQYRSGLLRRLLLHLEAKMDITLFKCTLLDAINLCSATWKKVTHETIQHCFRHAGFCKDISEQATNVDEKAEEEFRNIFTYLNNHFGEQMNLSEVSPQQYAVLDGKVATQSLVTDDEIVRHIQDQEEEDADSMQQQDEPGPPPPAVSLQKAFESLTVLRTFFAENGLGDQSLELIEQQMAQRLLKPQQMRQTKISDFTQ